MFPTAVSDFPPFAVRLIFIHNMESIRVIRSNYIWRIRRGGQSNKRTFRGNRDGSWDQIWGIPGSFMREGSIINDNGR